MTRQVDTRRDTVGDTHERDNLDTLQEVADIVLRTDNPIVNFTGYLYEKEYAASGTFVLQHNLGFSPLDFIVTSNSGGASVSVDNAGKTDIEVTVSAPTTLRFLLGRFS